MALTQLIGVVWINYATGWPLLTALAITIAAIYGQVTLNDFVLARYTPPAWRGRVYAGRFFLNFTLAGPAVWAIGRLYDSGGFGLVLWVTAVIAAIFVANTLVIVGLVTGAERARRMAQPAE